MTTKHNSRRAGRALLLAAVAAFATAGSAYAAPEPGVNHLRSRCDQGEFCAWDDPHYRGAIQQFDLVTAGTWECIPLPEGNDGRSFANRTSRDVTVYQGRDCSTEGDFTTYPGGGTYVPVAPFVVRAIQIWE